MGRPRHSKIPRIAPGGGVTCNWFMNRYRNADTTNGHEVCSDKTSCPFTELI